MLVIIALGVASFLLFVWLVLLCMPTNEDWLIAAYNKVHDNITAIDKLRQKDANNKKKMAEYRGVTAVVMGMFLGGNSKKEINKRLKQNEQLKNGEFRHVGVIDMPGYVLLRKFDSIGKGGLHKAILIKTLELYGRKHGENKAKQLLARLLSYPFVGVALSLLIGSAVMVFDAMIGLTILGIGTALVLVLVYAMYDEVHDQANKRRDAIARQFPNVVSKLALLVTSGMIMDRAWKETAYSQEHDIYREMQKTSEELENLVSPEAAYGAFITRCNTKETAKLASAIMQNLSKGNAEIGILLKFMAKEAWNERRHMAKRDSENAKGKLMIPSMLLLFTILIMIMVPIAMNFQGI